VFRATLTYVSPTIDPRSRTLRVKAQLGNPDGRLRPGLFARVVISSGLEAPTGQPAPAASAR
jgi:multidrug efflux pump subunit AcrA (membrane-fusion protein)